MAIVRNKTMSQILKICSNSTINTRTYHKTCWTTTSAPSATTEVGVKSMGFWLKDYEDYRKSLYGGNITHKALFVDAVGTLLVPAQSTAQVSLSLSSKTYSSFFYPFFFLIILQFHHLFQQFSFFDLHLHYITCLLFLLCLFLHSF